MALGRFLRDPVPEPPMPSLGGSQINTSTPPSLAARRIADPADPIGRRAREILPTSTGLSPQGVDLALDRCLETRPTDLELDWLCQSVPTATRAHVVLASNVFTAAHRAIALALATAARVEVRPSRREPEMTDLLRAADGGLFRVVDELAPSPGDHVWVYGTDETVVALRNELIGGVVLHAHGPGFGVAVFQPTAEDAEGAAWQAAAAAQALASDVVLFDQRGCLSPRLAFVCGDSELTREFALALAQELSRLEHTVPRGAVTPDEVADQTWYRDTWLCAGELLAAGRGWVGVETQRERVWLPPPGRNVHVVCASNLERCLRPVRAAVAAVGVSGPPELSARVSELLPDARLSPLGSMQRPRFDGPVDRRPSRHGEML